MTNEFLRNDDFSILYFINSMNIEHHKKLPKLPKKTSQIS